jgi:hypothetical protein
VPPPEPFEPEEQFLDFVELLDPLAPTLPVGGPQVRCIGPCGFYGDPVKECSYSAMAIARYQKKISGPLIDRIDIHVEVPRVDYEKLADKRNVEDSKTVRARVQAARERQLERFNGTKLTCNAEMGPTEVRAFCQTDASGEKLLKAAVQQLRLSKRRVSSCIEARTDDCGPGGKRDDTGQSCGGGGAVSAEGGDVGKQARKNRVFVMEEANGRWPPP